MNGKTGIEIQIGVTDGQRIIGKVLKALHLGALGDLVAKMYKGVITVDGKRVEEPLYEAHFVEVSPGTHQVEMFMIGRGPNIESIAEMVYGAKLEATVEAGRVTVLEYLPQDGVGASLKLISSRPA